jgi:hypothetical protein
MTNNDLYMSFNGLIFAVVAVLALFILIALGFAVGLACIMVCEVGEVWRKRAVDWAKVKRFSHTSAPAKYLPD